MRINGYEKLLLQPQREMNFGVTPLVINIYSVVEQNISSDHSEYLTLMREWDIPAYTLGSGFVYIINMTVNTEYTYSIMMWNLKTKWFAMVGLRNLTASQKSLLRSTNRTSTTMTIPENTMKTVNGTYEWLVNKVVHYHLDVWEGYS